MSKRYGADQKDYGAAKRSRRKTFKVQLECGHERNTWKIRSRWGSMCPVCHAIVPIRWVRMRKEWVPHDLALARLRANDDRYPDEWTRD